MIEFLTCSIAAGIRGKEPDAQGSGGFASCVPSLRLLALGLRRSFGGLHFARSLYAARAARRVPNVPFQSSIRAWMLLHAARRARSFFCGESATSLSSSSLPIGP